MSILIYIYIYIYIHTYIHIYTVNPQLGGRRWRRPFATVEPGELNTGSRVLSTTAAP